MLNKGVNLMRSNQSFESDLQLKVKLNEKYAALTFTQRDVKKNGKHHSFGDEVGLNEIEAQLHDHLPAENFIKHFDDHGEKTQFRHERHESFESAVASMAHYAFATHKGIILRPDDLHLLIIQGFARFLQQYPDDFRECVVKFTGKKDIKIFNFEPNSLDEWKFLPKGFAGLVQNCLTHPELGACLLQSYSDSTIEDATVKAITLLGTFSAYFNYSAVTRCYIP